MNCPTCKYAVKRGSYYEGWECYSYECQYDTQKTTYVMDSNTCKHYAENDGKYDWSKRKRIYSIERV